MTKTQANILLFEVGIVATSALVTLGGAVRGFCKVKKTAKQAKDVAGEVVDSVL